MLSTTREIQIIRSTEFRVNDGTSKPQNHTPIPIQSGFPKTEEVGSCCRNPERSSGPGSERWPWCYTMDPSERWEFCYIEDSSYCGEYTYGFPWHLLYITCFTQTPEYTHYSCLIIAQPFVSVPWWLNGKSVILQGSIKIAIKPNIRVLVFPLLIFLDYKTQIG